MQVELIAMSLPMNRTTDPMEIIERAAAVCYDSKPTTEYRIAKGCIASGHMSVLEHVAFTFHVKGISRACLAQLSRHRHISLSVRSQRYCREEDFSFVNPFLEGTSWAGDIYDAVKVSNDFYRELLEDGMNPEDARMVLPNACCTELYLTANARALIEISHLRLCSRAQKEIRQLFTMIRSCVKEVSPQIAACMVPNCEKHKDLHFCTEHQSCGRHPALKELYKTRDEPEAEGGEKSEGN